VIDGLRNMILRCVDPTGFPILVDFGRSYDERLMI
jgi:hypothetical protein